MAKRDYYDVLGISRSATDKELKSAYRRLAKKYHPDTNPGDKKTEQLFKEVTEAYNVLSDQEKRKLYDQFGHAAFDGSMGSDPGQYAEGGFHQSFYGKEPHFGGTRYSTSYETGDFDDFFGDMFGSFFHQRNATEGFSGKDGEERFYYRGPFGGEEGQGFFYEEPGTRDYVSEVTLSFREAALGCEKVLRFSDGETGTLAVKIPAGINEGQTIRLGGKGEKSKSGKTGDLLIKVHIAEDCFYSRKGQDVYTTQKIPYTVAILGGEARFDTLYGPVTCKIPAGSQAGSKLRLKNKGIVSMKNKHNYGDEYVTLQIQVPKTVTEQERELLTRLQKLQSGKTA